jgi:hypothetical protein
MGVSRILIHFTEQVLAINELQWAAPQRFELDSEALEFYMLPVRNHADDVSFVHSTKIPEAFTNAIACARTWNDKFCFIE